LFYLKCNRTAIVIKIQTILIEEEKEGQEEYGEGIDIKREEETGKWHFLT
jgi:hypothetical protein